MHFDDAMVQSHVKAIFGTDQDVGRGVSDLLANHLASGGDYTVIDRTVFDRLLADQNFSYSDRADSNSAARIGGILGVDAVIIGSVTQFGGEDKSGKGGVGNLGHIGIDAAESKKSKAVVNIEARLVSTQTGEILATVAATGGATRSGAGLRGGGAVSWTKGGGIDMTSSNFQQTILGEAVNSAVNSLAQKVEAQIVVLPPVKMSISGLVADAAADGTLVINIGSSAGLKLGDKVAVTRVTRLIKDPATGSVLRNVEETIGELTITRVNAESAVGKFAGAGTPKVGDRVRNN